MLLAASRMLDAAAVTPILRACSIVSFRYNVIGAAPVNDQQRVYNEIARKINDGTLRSSGEVIRELRSIYPMDTVFRSAFMEKHLNTASSRNTRVVRDILFMLEEHLSGVRFDRDGAQYRIEHVLPRNPPTGWDEFSEGSLRNSVDRLGNLTLMETKANRDLGNAPYAEKRMVYENQQFRLT